MKLTTDETMFIVNMMQSCQIYGKDAKIFVKLMDKIEKEKDRLLKLDNPSLKKVN